MYLPLYHLLYIISSKSISMKHFSSSIFLLFAFVYLISAATVPDVVKSQKQIQQNITQSNQAAEVPVTQKAIIGQIVSTLLKFFLRLHVIWRFGTVGSFQIRYLSVSIIWILTKYLNSFLNSATSRRK